MEYNLGLVCKLTPETINAINKLNNYDVRFKKDWYKLSISGKVCKSHKEFLELSEVKQYELSIKRTLKNINYTHECIKVCIENGVSNYRVSSELIAKPEYWSWKSDDTVLYNLNKIKDLCVKNDITLTIHPDQFCVLNSLKDDVVENSIKILEYHYDLSAMLGIEHIILHTGSTKPNKAEALNRFIDNYNRLLKGLQKLIRLENCHSYSIQDLMYISKKCLNLDLCYDLHHERVVDKYTNTSDHYNMIEYLEELNNNKTICHLSSGRDHINHKSHGDYISEHDIDDYVDIIKAFPKVIFEIEAKKKEQAIYKIINKLK